MIKKLRIKFIAITSAALLLMLLTIFILINIFMGFRSNDQVDHFLYDLVNNDGVLSEKSFSLAGSDSTYSPRESPPVLIKNFAAKLSSNGTIQSLSWDKLLFTEEEVMEFVENAYHAEAAFGKISGYKFVKVKKDYGILIVFADQSVQDHMLLELLNLSYITGTVSFIVLFIITIFLSKLIVQPIGIAFEKQKAFVTDSGHELKTPLSIISAKTEILEMEYGKNKHFDAIKNQTWRMNVLTKNLLSLAKLENLNQKENFNEFDLSYLIENTALTFESLAFEKGKLIVLELEKDIKFKGDKSKIKKMIEALIDNAVKYAASDSEIKIHLYTKGSKKIIQMQNKFFGSLPKENTKLFDRFYRGDKSRSSEIAGYGIGLSIVKNIVEIHNGKISIDHFQNETFICKIIF